MNDGDFILASHHNTFAAQAIAAQALIMKTDAKFSDCRCYRYALWRRWADGPQVFFLMLNPSTADEFTNDPTIRRCIGFAESWGFGALAVGNLFAWRSPTPQILKTVPDPIGPNNDQWLLQLHLQSQLAIAAWGNHGKLLERGIQVKNLIAPFHSLGTTKQGEPRHPLYLPSTTEPLPWRELR